MPSLVQSSWSWVCVALIEVFASCKGTPDGRREPLVLNMHLPLVLIALVVLGHFTIASTIGGTSTFHFLPSFVSSTRCVGGKSVVSLFGGDAPKVRCFNYT